MLTHREGEERWGERDDAEDFKGLLLQKNWCKDISVEKGKLDVGKGRIKRGRKKKKHWNIEFNPNFVSSRSCHLVPYIFVIVTHLSYA